MMNGTPAFNLNEVMATASQDNEKLGHLTWYTISEVDIDRAKLASMLQAKGFERHMLREISPCDAFRRATTEIQRNNVESGQTDIFHNYLVREVYSDRKEIVRHIVIETVDKQGKKLSYEPQEATIRYDKTTDKVEYKASSLMADGLIQESLLLFEKFKLTYNSRHVREMIANILSEFSPISVRPSGGVYFVPEKYEMQLTSLVKLVNDLGESDSHMVPLISSRDNKDMIRKKLKDHIRTAINEAAGYLKEEESNKFVAKQKLAMIKQVIKDHTEYQEVLNDELDDMAGMLTLLKEQGNKILGRID